jgi:hypothetical protein
MMLDHRRNRDRDHRVLEANASQVIILTYFILFRKWWQNYDQGGVARTCLHCRSLTTPSPRRLGSWAWCPSGSSPSGRIPVIYHLYTDKIMITITINKQHINQLLWNEREVSRVFGRWLPEKWIRNLWDPYRAAWPLGVSSMPAGQGDLPLGA